MSLLGCGLTSQGTTRATPPKPASAGEGGALRSLTTTLLLGDGQWLGPPPRAFLGEAAQMRQLGPGRFRASGFYFPHLDLWFPRPREAKRLAQEHTATDWAFST